VRSERFELNRADDARAVVSAVRALVPAAGSVHDAVAEIVAAVRERGDAALAEYTRKFDTKRRKAPPLRVTGEELDAAAATVSGDVRAGLQTAIANVAEVAAAGVLEDHEVQLPEGHTIVVRELPVRRAAVYVPGGRSPYPSTVVMGVVTARAAGVLDVAVCAPPGVDGQIDPLILGACRLCGVSRVYRMGGAQAVAALAYGTETIDRVDVIVGPGNLYVQEAKRQLSSEVGIDGFAGPSDLTVVLGEQAGEDELRLAALDMLAQGEHGEGSLVVGVCCRHEACEQLAEALNELVVERPTVRDATCRLVEVKDARAGVELANALAPEHLQLIGGDVEALAGAVRAAGCLFVGATSATAFGDYVAGSNHVLPTGGAARFASALSPRHFRRRMAEVRIDAQAARQLAAAGAPIARAEGFEVHAESMEARMRNNPQR
jgi:histidinol dehydrogenase